MCHGSTARCLTLSKFIISLDHHLVNILPGAPPTLSFMTRMI